MDRSRRAFGFLCAILAILATSATAQPPGPVEPPLQALEARVSLTDRDLVYGGVDRPEGEVARGGEVFGWHDGSIRLAGMLDTAGGCADPRGVTATLAGHDVRVVISYGTGDNETMACPAVYTPHLVFVRVTGLKPGRYHVKVVAARGASFPRTPDGVHVPAPPEPPF